MFSPSHHGSAPESFTAISDREAIKLGQLRFTLRSRAGRWGRKSPAQKEAMRCISRNSHLCLRNEKDWDSGGLSSWPLSDFMQLGEVEAGGRGRGLSLPTLDLGLPTWYSKSLSPRLINLPQHISLISSHLTYSLLPCWSFCSPNTQTHTDLRAFAPAVSSPRITLSPHITLLSLCHLGFSSNATSSMSLSQRP